MKMIDQMRDYDSLEQFGKVLRFSALVYENEEEGEATGGFEPYNMDGDVAFPASREQADTAFDAWVEVLKEQEEDFLDDGETEGFVALIDTPKGLMILAGTNIMAYPNPENVEELLPGVPKCMGMPHVTWERILYDVFNEDVDEEN